MFPYSNQTVHSIWNTTAGGDSTPAVSGYTTGTYYPTEPPKHAFDGNFSSDYTNHGMCNTSITTASITCGEKTGIYLTLPSGPIIPMAFYMVTNSYALTRNPATITVEGSRLNGSALTNGSSWTLIYNGATGLQYIPTRATIGPIQIFPTFPMPFASYRFLITSKNGIETSTSFAELRLIGY